MLRDTIQTGMEQSVNPKIALTNKVEILSGSHILYVYSTSDHYIENAVAFISTGLKLGQIVVFIDQKGRFTTILQKLLEKGYTNHQVKNIIFISCQDVYKLNMEESTKKFIDLIVPYVERNIPFRTWCNIKVTDQHLNPKVNQYMKLQRLSNRIISDVNSVTVSAFDGTILPSSIQIELMKEHQYVMTDTDFFPSSLYYKNANVPSIGLEEKLESENSQLKYKLDIHKKYNRDLLEQIPDAVIIGGLTGIIYANRAAGELLECNPNVLLGRKALDFVHPDYHEHLKERMAMLELGQKLPLVEEKFITFKGNVVDVEIRTFQFLFEAEEPTSITIARNITERKKSEALAIKTEKLSVTGELAAGIAHEIRNPLTAIKGFLQLCKLETDNNEYFSIIEQEINQIETIASELLVLGKPTSQKFEVYNLCEIIHNVCTLLHTQAIMKNIDIDFDYDTDDMDSYRIYCVGGQIKQVFINLIKNGIEAMGDGGIISIRLRKTSRNIYVDIHDEGNGIPKDILKKIGEPFYTTKEKGTGLGLMVCYAIIDQHSGVITVKSDKVNGTTFTVRLPLKRN